MYVMRTEGRRAWGEGQRPQGEDEASRRKGQEAGRPSLTF